MAFPRLRTAGHRRRRAAASESHQQQQLQRPRTAPARPPTPPRDLDTSTLHSSLSPTGPDLPRHFSAPLTAGADAAAAAAAAAAPPVALATSDGVHEERGAGDSPVSESGAGGGRDDLIQHMRDQLRTANSVIRFLHEHVDGMREDRDRYRDRVEELKSLARLTLDMLEGAHRREWEVGREVREVRDRAVGRVKDDEEGREQEEKEGDQQQQPKARRRDSIMRKIGLGKKEGKEKEREKEREKGRERSEQKTKHDSARDEAQASLENNLPTTPTIVQYPGSSAVAGAAAASSHSTNARRKRGHVKSHSASHARLRDDGVLAIPADELERLVQAMDRNVNMLREDIKKLVEEVNTHKHAPVYTSLTDVPPRFG